MYVIRTENLTKMYGKTMGVNNINLEIMHGEVFGFIGPNGAGKSTTIRMIMQLIYPTSGEIYLFNEKLQGEQAKLRKKIGYLPSEVNYYKDLTGRQIIDFTAKAFGLDVKKTKVSEYIDILQLDLDKKVRSYSLGNRKKLGIIQSMLHSPELLILDEPTSGLDPLMQNAFFDILKKEKDRGTTIFFSTHVLTEVEKICDRVAIIRTGEILQTSRVEDIEGKEQRIVTVQFKEEGNMIDLYNLNAIADNVEYTHGVHRFIVKNDIHLAIRAISEHPIKDISVQQPTLEQLFMEYYEREGSVS